ncbi:hypothetical protein Q3O60_08495 [Alkalimonas collagenimarina]|uniref:Uncharacterized protein n=1 Tax=Alkalimonas collagenimarina TaxID=400390 RepID=A0ABT9GYT2_9GAMM|nr:hypothetical protein [Alkalimonas collagenimarina]MDP4536224.1 hypothetical protein [Alkalimonas collagenimarina]
MRQFPEIDPLTIKQHPNLVASLVDNDDPRTTWYFLIIDDYMLIADAMYFTYKDTGVSKWLHYQIEFPKQGLLWYLDSLRTKFFKTEAEGGLPKGKFHDKAVVDGEELKLKRCFGLGADGRGGGYAFVTLDRKNERGFAKQYAFTDALLFEHGLIDVLDDIAAKIKAGVL